MPQPTDTDELRFADLIRPGDVVAWGQACGEPLRLTRQLMAQRHQIGGFGAFIGISLGDSADPEHADCVRFRSFCGTGRNGRLAAAGKLDILPLHYSQLASVLMRQVDVLMLQVTRHPNGGYSLGACCDYVAALIPAARLVIAEVNRQVPVTDARIDARQIDVMVEADYAPAAMTMQPPSRANRRIAAHVASLIDDGATLQFGLGATPDCVAALLLDRRHLGLHSGVLSDAGMALMASGAIDNSRKPIDAGLSVAGTLLGTPELLAFADSNTAIAMRPISHTHDTATIARLPAFTAINSALEVDLSGQANTESAGGRYLGTIGGAVDFSRGAQASEGGKAILALTATAQRRDGTLFSRIVPRLSGPATVGRGDIGIVVTENGIADLRGQTLDERRRRLTAIADPAFRDDLTGAEQ
ncbi:acetyl-CoA hydrolase [Roseovarius sp. A46]|uniref:acetyl-CoA hydrolase/transferase family protein n=1 Tax=Roseovarius sp. A46 TaxID=2109331 RepID=UPI0010138067|nr:acetyl-CoA hydrolase/transferase C-terminal domain-containing protein [Roseovarius sp. A46]RXV59159.1 acetyl-CoA hydrolase [Roseovarius sp. A46]